MLKGVVTQRGIEIHVGSTDALQPSSGMHTNWLRIMHSGSCHLLVKNLVSDVVFVLVIEWGDYFGLQGKELMQSYAQTM